MDDAATAAGNAVGGIRMHPIYFITAGWADAKEHFGGWHKGGLVRK